MEKAQKNPDLLTVDEAAAYLSVSRRSIESMIAERTIRGVNVSVKPNAGRKSWRFHRQDLDTFLKNRAVKPSAA